MTTQYDLEYLKDELASLKNEKAMRDAPPSQAYQSPQNICSRERAKTVILEMAEKHRQKAAGLEQLARFLAPLEDNLIADEALWNLAISARNH